MMKTLLDSVLNLRANFRLRPFGRVSMRDWALYFTCLTCFALVLAAGNWVAEHGAGDELETWLGSSAAFVVLAILTRFSGRLRG
jgi:hypothetical protein